MSHDAQQNKSAGRNIRTDFTATASLTLSLDKEGYDRFAKWTTPTGHVTVERAIYPQGKRCLWGHRTGYIQIGSAEDRPKVLRVTIPAAHLTVEQTA